MAFVYWVMQLAKYNVEKHFTIIGITEEYNATLVLFEAAHPEFFKLASYMVKKGQMINQHVRNKSLPQLSQKAREIWRFVRH